MKMEFKLVTLAFGLLTSLGSLSLAAPLNFSYCDNVINTSLADTQSGYDYGTRTQNPPKAASRTLTNGDVTFYAAGGPLIKFSAKHQVVAGQTDFSRLGANQSRVTIEHEEVGKTHYTIDLELNADCSIGKIEYREGDAPFISSQGVLTKGQCATNSSDAIVAGICNKYQSMFGGTIQSAAEVLRPGGTVARTPAPTTPTTTTSSLPATYSGRIPGGAR